jgi:hypothetical protein
MADNKPQPTHPNVLNSSPRMYSPSLQPLLQSLLATLANIDFEYERERERLSDRTLDMALKVRVLEKLKQHHHERREPYVQQLSVLQDRIRQGVQ